MNTLIVYASKYGCTKDCVEKMKNELDGEVTVVDGGKDKIPSVKNYDRVVIGGSIYVGQINKKVKAFASENLKELLTKKIGLFVVCGFADKLDEYLDTNFPKELREHASSAQCFGGEMNPDKMNFLHKGVVKMIEKQMDVSQIKLVPENINKLASEMR